MEDGNVISDTRERECVISIFSLYVDGASLSEIAQHLNQSGSYVYSQGKPWNKNMIDRILQDKRYEGNSIFPAVVPPSLFSAAHLARSVRCCPQYKTEAQKMLRHLGCQKSTAEIEAVILALMNQLIKKPDIIQIPSERSREQTQLFRASRMLDDVLDANPVDEEKAAKLILEQAHERYKLIGDEEYETERLKRIFERAAPVEELPANLLRKTVSEITVGKDTVCITLKNNQAIEMRVRL